MNHNCREPRDLHLDDKWDCKACGRRWRAGEQGSTRINEDGSVWRQ
jgi:hypothetical protein